MAEDFLKPLKTSWITLKLKDWSNFTNLKIGWGLVSVLLACRARIPTASNVRIIESLTMVVTMVSLVVPSELLSVSPSSWCPHFALRLPTELSCPRWSALTHRSILQCPVFVLPEQPWWAAQDIQLSAEAATDLPSLSATTGSRSCPNLVW